MVKVMQKRVDCASGNMTLIEARYDNPQSVKGMQHELIRDRFVIVGHKAYNNVQKHVEEWVYANFDTHITLTIFYNN